MIRLARILGLAEPAAVELARGARLPFSVSGLHGFHVHSHDLAACQ